jgi:hypothetical protein
MFAKRRGNTTKPSRWLQRKTTKRLVPLERNKFERHDCDNRFLSIYWSLLLIEIVDEMACKSIARAGKLIVPRAKFASPKA